jgi:hypothetical protein
VLQNTSELPTFSKLPTNLFFMNLPTPMCCVEGKQREVEPPESAFQRPMGRHHGSQEVTDALLQRLEGKKMEASVSTLGLKSHWSCLR